VPATHTIFTPLNAEDPERATLGGRSPPTPLGEFKQLAHEVGAAWAPSSSSNIGT